MSAKSLSVDGDFLCSDCIIHAANFLGHSCRFLCHIAAKLEVE